MTEKRYFQKEWEECYWIFDSEKVTEKEFDERTEYDNDVFADSMHGDEVVDRLNALHEEKEMWKRECQRLKGMHYLENENIWIRGYCRVGYDR